MAAHEGLVVAKHRPGEQRYVVFGADVPQRYRGVAGHPGALGPQDGRIVVTPAKRRGRHFEEERQRRVRMLHVGRNEGGVRLVARGSGVGADLLTDIAAEDPVAHERTQRAWDGATLFDRLKGDARRRVDG